MKIMKINPKDNGGALYKVTFKLGVNEFGQKLLAAGKAKTKETAILVALKHAERLLIESNNKNKRLSKTIERINYILDNDK